MPETTGVEFLCSVKNDYPNAIRMLITAYTDINTVIEAVNKCQVYKYLTKPWDIKELRSVIDRAYEVYVLREENKQLISDLLNINDKLDLLLKQNDINMLLQSKPDKLSQFKRGFDDIVGFITKKDK